jgi:hypothetical protein
MARSEETPQQARTAKRKVTPLVPARAWLLRRSRGPKRWRARNDQVLREYTRRHSHPADVERVQALVDLVHSLQQRVEALERRDLDHLLSLLNTGRVEDARRWLKVVGPDKTLDAWREVLRPPVAREVPATGKDDLGKVQAWLDTKRVPFIGKWVALLDGDLVDSDASRVALHRRLEQAPRFQEMIFICVTG